jgi:guanine deaminase
VGQSPNCVTSTNAPTAHAEIMAIRDACQRLGTFIYAELAKPYPERSIPTEQALQREAKLVFDEWVRKQNKVKY